MTIFITLRPATRQASSCRGRCKLRLWPLRTRKPTTLNRVGPPATVPRRSWREEAGDVDNGGAALDWPVLVGWKIAKTWRVYASSSTRRRRRTGTTPRPVSPRTRLPPSLLPHSLLAPLNSRQGVKQEQWERGKEYKCEVQN